MKPSLRHPRPARLVRKGDFARVYREGSRARGDVLTVVVAENGLERSRMGLSVGKRVSKRAVRRNRVRRVFREAFRLSQHELPGGVDLILIATQKDLDPDLDRTRRELVHLAHKALRRFREKQAARPQVESP